jgi:hypothetical protein
MNVSTMVLHIALPDPADNIKRDGLADILPMVTLTFERTLSAAA